jgi:hypothetical protein
VRVPRLISDRNADGTINTDNGGETPRSVPIGGLPAQITGQLQGGIGGVTIGG